MATLSDTIAQFLEPVPTLDPAVAALIGVAVGFLAMLKMNRGDAYFVNLRAQDEPFLVGVGAGLLVAPVPALVRGIGIALVLLGVASRYTGLYNVNFLFGGGSA